jgi:esterase/lipase superfamily enzyme
MKLTHILKVFRDESALDLIEYAIVALLIALVGVVALEMGVSSKPTSSNGKPPKLVNELANYETVQVFYATDRNHLQPLNSIEQYGRDRSDNGSLALGVSSVSVPRDHLMGNLERPSIWHLDFQENPEKHIVLLSAQQVSYQDFYRGLSGSLEKTRQKRVLVFVPGFAVTFEDALRRTAQISYDLNYDGVPVVFSWPSKGKVNPLDYSADEASAEWSALHLNFFLEDLVLKSGAKSVDLIAHSMGNRVLSRSLQQIAGTKSASAKFNEVILTAPDIDRGVFLQLAEAMGAVSRRVTVYTSQNDKALQASMKLHAYPRAGEQADLIVGSGLDSIDASRVATDFIDHSYFANNQSVISDMYYLLRGTVVDQRFGIRKVPTGKGSYYYRFMPQS